MGGSIIIRWREPKEKGKMRKYIYGVWPTTSIMNGFGTPKWALYQELMNQAFSALDESSEDVSVMETAIITLKRNGRVYQIKIEDITAPKEDKDEIISIKIENKSDSKSEHDEDSENYYTE